MINSTISDASKGVRFLGVDLKDLFLGSFMRHPEFMRIPLSIFPDNTIEGYNLNNSVCSEGYIYIKIKKDLYGLKRAAILAYTQLDKYLKPFGYASIPFSLSL